ncbi:Uncharacterised protein [BD1-7 clade bacterium]|uniref:GST N-terminal domain-containing protein n=1 Tax=BD1-7 clade bacterium TaxID=2029982 RepID=A0A5S9P7V9_9GAMM|nr:Uncharacterised protein [BD1-7 clade bacterium]CAA0099513.1 Uncharacterised protein [BD1-7 clade bacterium]
MITLYQPPQTFDLINISPFCTKLETFLRMAKIPYQCEPVSMKTFMRAPNGKVPWVEVDGKAIPDSDLIINYLADKYAVTLSKGYSVEDSAVLKATQRLLEEHLYWGIGYFRWVETANWPITVLSIFAPNMLGKKPIGMLMKWSSVKQLKAHGLGRHNAETILSKCKQDLDTLSTFLGDSPYYLGDEPGLADCLVFGFLDGIMHDPTNNQLTQAAQKYDNLREYCERMGSQYFPEVYSR